VASIGSDSGSDLTLERTVSAIASARRAVRADRFPSDSFVVEWRPLQELGAIEDEWRALSGRALEPNIFYEPGFARAAGEVFGRGVGAVLVWSRAEPRALLGLFPARIVRRRWGIALPVLMGWTHPYAPLGTPLVDRDAAEPVITAWLAYVGGEKDLPGLVSLPLILADGPFAAMLHAMLRRSQRPVEEFGRHERSSLEPHGDREHYVEARLSNHRLRELQRGGRRLADQGALLFSTTAQAAGVGSALDDFFALEAAGWKGRVGTAAARDQALQRFVKTAMAALAATHQVAIGRLFLDGRAIAAAITLRSGDNAWYWKTAYDERLARYAPGVLVTAALTERLAEDLEITRTDSCAAPHHSMIEELWGERLALSDLLFAVRPGAPFARARRLELARRKLEETARAFRARLRRRH
jgi:CelD/BcsL family acetyltransferase involved in cellulose biosynthesis